MAVIDSERSAGGDVSCVVQFGGQTPLKLALALQEAGVTILGTSPDSIDLAEDRQRFSQLLWDLGIPQPASGTAISRAEARDVADAHRLPGGRAAVVRARRPRHGDRVRRRRRSIATWPSAVDVSHDRPVLIDRFLEDAFEFDVDCVADATGAVVIGGIMEHIEEAGIHSGDSSCVVPPFMVAERHLATIRDYTRRIARALKVVGLMNVQYAIKDDTRLRARGEPARVAHGAVPLEGDRRAAGEDRRARDGRPDARGARACLTTSTSAGVFVKSPVFPFVRFPGVDTILGPEMKSTGEVMGGADSFGAAFAKAMLAAGQRLPESGTRVHQREQQRQADGAADRARPGGARLHASSPRAARRRTCARTASRSTWCTR